MATENLLKKKKTLGARHHFGFCGVIDMAELFSYFLVKGVTVTWHDSICQRNLKAKVTDLPPSYFKKFSTIEASVSTIWKRFIPIVEVSRWRCICWNVFHLLTIESLPQKRGTISALLVYKQDIGCQKDVILFSLRSNEFVRNCW